MPGGEKKGGLLSVKIATLTADMLRENTCPNNECFFCPKILIASASSCDMLGPRNMLG